MGEFLITTDSCADLPDEYFLENNIKCIPLYYNVGDKTYGEEEVMEPKEFYDKMRKGLMPTTMAANPDYIENAFRNILEKGFDILHVAFSSGLSSTYNSAVIAANEVREDFPSRKVLVIDSKSASLGQGLLVHKLIKFKEEGKTIEETAAWAEENICHVCHQFTVDDLFHLHRGGRISKTTAIVGTLINVKPVLHVDDEGKLVSLHNVRGRKKSLQNLVDTMKKNVEGYDNDIVFISHGDCVEDAEYVADLIKEQIGIEKFLINYVSPTIGTHSGPGTVALFYIGAKR